MLSALYMAGIAASKQTRDEKFWSVEVDERDLQHALFVVREQGLPREQFSNSGELFKKEGLISTPAEERIRYIYAVSQELSDTLSQIDGVVSARVHPVIPANDPLANHARPSSASVFIKHRRDADLSALAPAIRNLVMRGIEGLTYENIALTFVAADEGEGAAIQQRSTITAGASALTIVLTVLLVFSMTTMAWLWNRYSVAIGREPTKWSERLTRAVQWIGATLRRLNILKQRIVSG
jgi:type III secretion protein J